MFIKASSEFQDAGHPIHKQSADHKHMLEDHITELAEKAGIPAFVAEYAGAQTVREAADHECPSEMAVKAADLMLW